MGMSPLRLRALLRRGRDSVETNVGEETDAVRP